MRTGLLVYSEDDLNNISEGVLMTIRFTDIQGAADLRDADREDEFDTDVFIVGTGPTGATTALALARYGIRATMISQFAWLANTPRAHITNLRAVEVLRDLGLEEDAKRYAVPWEKMGDTLFTTSLAGPEVARIQTWGTGDHVSGEYRKHSPCTMLDIPQTKMEPLLVKHAAEQGARTLSSTKYLGHSQDEDGVTVNLLNRTSGQEFSLRAKFLVGADGANSQVAKDIGLDYIGHTGRQGTVYARFSADLSKYVEHRPSILHWIMNPVAGFGEIGMGTMRAVEPWSKWIAGWGFDPKGAKPDLSDEYVLQQIRALVGDPDLDVQLEGTSVWYVNQQYATSMSKGRVFCGGDATHRHPPSSGLGSNTCMQDAFNLAWKLAYVVKGWAGIELLESYSQERTPIGKQIVSRANQSRLDYAAVRECFPTETEDGTHSIELGLSRLYAPTEDGERLRKRLDDALHLKDQEFNALGLEADQRFRSSAVIPDSLSSEIEMDPEYKGESILKSAPTTEPGAKVPHAWLVGADGKRVSTIDVTGKGRFTLLTGASGVAWQEAADKLDLPFLDVLRIDAGEIRDAYTYWARIREVEEAGCLLVRPDGVVAWRHMDVVRDAEIASEQLRFALSNVLQIADLNTRTHS